VRRLSSRGSPALYFQFKLRLGDKRRYFEVPLAGLLLEDDGVPPNRSCVFELPELPAAGGALGVEAPPAAGLVLEVGVEMGVALELGVVLPGPDCGGVALLGTGDTALGVVPIPAPDSALTPLVAEPLARIDDICCRICRNSSVIDSICCSSRDVRAASPPLSEFIAARSLLALPFSAP